MVQLNKGNGPKKYNGPQVTIDYSKVEIAITCKDTKKVKYNITVTIQMEITIIEVK